MFIIFRKMKEGIRNRIDGKQPGLSVALIFPIAFSFLLTFIGSRVFSHLAPDFYLFEVEPGLRIHHFTYGFFILAIAGYLALIHNGPRGTYWIALLFGMGLGLAFDEFGMWLRLKDDEIARFNYDGFNIAIGFFFLVLFAKPGIKLLKRLWPF